MITQILHSSDSDLLNYLKNKYSNDKLLNHQNFLIEIRDISGDIFLQSKPIFSESIRAEKFYSTEGSINN